MKRELSHYAGTSFGIIAGACAAGLAILAASQETFFTAAIILAVMTGFTFVALRHTGRVKVILLIALALGLAMRIDISFFHYLSSDFMPRVSSAPGITVTLVMLCALFITGIHAYERWQGRRERVFHPYSPLLAAMLLFWGAGVLTLINADDKQLVVFGLIQAASLIFVFAATASLSVNSLRHLTIGIAITTIIQAIIAIIQFTTDSSLGLDILGEEEIIRQMQGTYTISRSTGTFPHANILAYFFELAIPLMLACMIASRTAGQRLLYLIASAAGLAGVVSTMSRGAWVAIPLTLVLVLVLLLGRRLLRLRAGMVAMGVVLIALASLPVTYSIIEQRLTADDHGSSELRIPLMHGAWSLIEQFPVLGVGLNNFADAFEKYDQTDANRIFVVNKGVVHNLYLLMWAETGTVGFLFFLGQFAVFFILARRAASRAPPMERAIIVGASAGVLGHLIHAIFDPGYPMNLGIAQMMYVYFGLVSAAAYACRARSPKRLHATLSEPSVSAASAGVR